MISMKNPIIRISLIILCLALLLIICNLSIRFFKYINIRGTYEQIEGSFIEEELKLNFFSWTIGKKEDLECDLWNCTGYEKGNMYYIKDGYLYLRYNKHGVREAVQINIKKENKITYLIIKEKNADNKYTTSKLRKID